MMAPSKRLLWVSAVLVVPLAAAASLDPHAAPVCIAALAVLLAFAVFDALQGRRRIESVLAGGPALLRITKGVETTLPLVLENRAGMPLPLRVALALPDGLESAEKVLPASAPVG